LAQEFSNKALQAYYDYLRDIIFGSERYSIDLDALEDEEFKLFGEALMQFGKMAIETRIFALCLSRGELDCSQPSTGNELAAPLRSLHATLKHLTWQTKQISGGDYDQHVDFMGEFSDAFNEMIAQLAERRREMEVEAEHNKERMDELAKANSIFEAITGNMEEWIVMVDRASGKHLFSNRSTGSVLTDSGLEYQMNNIIFEYANANGDDETPRKEEFSLISDYALQFFEIMLYPIKWFEYDAVACVLTDVTASKEEFSRLENAAYKDVMTGVFNRLYGMRLLDQYKTEKTPFELIFIDMDMLKYVNDVFGHAEGDAYIKSVADILQEVSPMATVCRLGGDEFMVILREVDKRHPDTHELLEIIRTDLSLTSVRNEGEPPLYQRSISYGIIKNDERCELSTSEILAAADERMYEYKKAHKQDRRV